MGSGNGLAVVGSGGENLARAERPEAHGLDMVRDLAGVFALADALKDAAGFLPSWVKTRGQAVAVLLAGRELGIPPMRAFRVLHSIEGKIELAASEMLALLIRGGVRIEWLKSDGTVAHGRFTRPGYPTHEEVYTLDDARAAGLAGKGNWSKHPKAMLRARCASGAARWWAPDLLGNVYVEGEISETVESRGASSGSPEVRVLGAAVHEADEAPAGPDPFAHAHHALAQCKTDGDLRAWSRAFGEAIERAPDDDNRRNVWAAAKRKARGVVPPIQVATLTAWFLEDRQARAAKAAPIEGVTEEATPLQRAMDELASCETREALFAWTDDNASTLATLTANDAPDVWRCIYARCEMVGGINGEELEARLS